MIYCNSGTYINNSLFPHASLRELSTGRRKVKTLSVIIAHKVQVSID